MAAEDSSLNNEQSAEQQRGLETRGEEGGRLGKDLDVKFRYVNFIGRQGEILSRDCILEKSVRDICRER